jgi:spore coat polysaccharide biosynthesis protein SpsF
MDFILNYFYFVGVFSHNTRPQSMTAIAIIQARMSSTRLPCKVLLPLAGRPILWHIVQRARACKEVDEVVVATSTDPSDDQLVSFCKGSDIEFHRGSLSNVLSRYTEILEKKPHDYCVRITGDCPLIDPDFIDLQLQALSSESADFIWLSSPVPVLCGQGAHSSRSLFKVASASSHPDDLEHVGSRYFSTHPDEFKIVGLNPPQKLASEKWRVTVDEPVDYLLMQELYKSLWEGDGYIIALNRALKWLNENPKVSSINNHIVESVANQEQASRLATLRKSVVSFYERTLSNGVTSKRATG